MTHAFVVQLDIPAELTKLQATLQGIFDSP